MHSDWLKSQVTCNIQSECLISAWHSYANQKFVYDRFDALSQKKGSFDFINLNKEIILKQTIFGLWRQLIKVRIYCQLLQCKLLKTTFEKFQTYVLRKLTSLANKQACFFHLLLFC